MLSHNEQQFLIAAASGDMDTMKKLLEEKTNINVVEEYSGNSALHLAAQAGYVEMVDYLLSKGAISHYNSRGKLPIHLAAEMGHDKVIIIFAEKNGPIDLLRPTSHCDDETIVEIALKIKNYPLFIKLYLLHILPPEYAFKCAVDHQDMHAIKLVLDWIEKDKNYNNYRLSILHGIVGIVYENYDYPEPTYSLDNEPSGWKERCTPLFLHEEALLLMQKYTTPSEYSLLIYEMILACALVNTETAKNFFEQLQKIFKKTWPAFVVEISKKLQIDMRWVGVMWMGLADHDSPESQKCATVALIRWLKYCSPQTFQEQLKSLVSDQNDLLLAAMLYFEDSHEEFIECAKYFDNWKDLLKYDDLDKSAIQKVFNFIGDPEKIHALLSENNYEQIRLSVSNYEKLKAFLKQFKLVEQKEILRKILPNIIEVCKNADSLQFIFDLVKDKDFINDMLENTFKKIRMRTHVVSPKLLLTYFQYLPRDKQGFYATRFGPIWILGLIVRRSLQDDIFCMLQLLTSYGGLLFLNEMKYMLSHGILPDAADEISVGYKICLEFLNNNYDNLLSIGKLQQKYIISNPDEWHTLLNMEKSAHQLTAIAQTSKATGALHKLPVSLLNHVLTFQAPAKPEPYHLFKAMQQTSPQNTVMDVKNDNEIEAEVKKYSQRLKGLLSLWQKASPQQHEVNGNKRRRLT